MTGTEEGQVFEEAVVEKEPLAVGIYGFDEEATFPVKVGSSGYMLYARIPGARPGMAGTRVVQVDKVQRIKTGFNIVVPEGLVGHITGLTETAAKHRVFVVDQPFGLTAQHKGNGPEFEVTVPLYNDGERDFTVRDGDPIGVLSFSVVPDVSLVELTEPPEPYAGEEPLTELGLSQQSTTPTVFKRR